MTKPRRRSTAKLSLIMPDGNAADIPFQLRRMADEIEAGEHGDVRMMVSVMEADDVGLYGWGNIDGFRAIGMLSYGLAKLNAQTREWADEE